MTNHEAVVLSAFTGTLVGKFEPFFQYVKFILNQPNLQPAQLAEYSTMVAIKKAAIADVEKLDIDGITIGEIVTPDTL